MGVYIISDHIQIKLWKKCSVEFFSPAFAKCQTSKMLPTEVNCLIPRNNTLLIFICYQDRMVELCQHKFWPSWPPKMAPGDPRGPKKGHILPMMAIFAHRHLQRLQMSWTLVEQGWTLSNTSMVTCLGPYCPQKVASGGPRGPKKGHILPVMAIFGHRHLQRQQMGWTLVEQGWTLSNTSRVTCLGP